MAIRRIRCGVVLACAGSLVMMPLRVRAQLPELAGARIRCVGPVAAGFVNEGRERSPTFRKLVEELDASDWIVFVQRGSCRLTGVRGCLLHQVGSYDASPYLRVVVSEPFGSDDETIATIGHELQHAVEVVRAPGISDAGHIRQLYRRIGYVSVRRKVAGEIGEVYETGNAISAGAAVLRELRANRRAEGAPSGASRRPRPR